jgi:hypothetical protein
MECARRHFPHTTIRIVSNGLLLPKMPKAFWETCKENNITISVTKYPINLYFEGIQALAAGHGVSFEFFGIAVGKTSYNLAFVCSGTQDPSDSFMNCSMANECVRLRNGKIATCSPILNIAFFNEYFQKDLRVCPEDCIDIYEAESGREILDFIGKPVPFCRYCDVRHRSYDNPWRVSGREIDEYVLETEKTANAPEAAAGE